MVDVKRLVAPVIEELIGLATNLVPTGSTSKGESSSSSLSEFDFDDSVEKIRTMKELLGELKEKEAFTSCPACVDHIKRVEDELKWAEEHVPSYQKAMRLKTQLKELYELVKPEGTLAPPGIAEGKPKKEEETPQHCLECSLNAILDAKRYLKEAQASDTQDRYIKRLLGAKEELQHAQDHLSDKFPDLATKVRSLRKSVDPIILKGEVVKPLPLSIEDLEAVQNEILTLARKV